MTLDTLIRLTKSLSGSEKRYFKIYTNKQTGNKDYLGLFNIIDQVSGSDSTFVKQQFNKLHPQSSLNNTARYLLKLMTDSLIQSKTEKDNFFQLLHEIMRIKILQERSLSQDGHILLKKIRKAASISQQHLIEYLTYREELNYSSDSNFQDTNDKMLVENQMKAKDILKMLNHIHDHHSLFELLKYRLVHFGKISSDEEKKRLNDLMLSEMILVAGKSKNSFAAQKLHLLFQSFFFTDIGDYHSALRTFYSLNKLFEENLKLLDNPPIDYITALNGILNILNTFRKFEDIHFYIAKVAQLDQSYYPEYFRFQVKKTIAVYELAIFTGEKKWEEAVGYINGLDDAILKTYEMIDEEKQWELYFYCSLVFFANKEWKKAHQYISEVMQHHKMQPQLFICKAIRLLNIIIYYEIGDIDYLEYEIRSYKRLFGKKHPLLKTEKLLLKAILAKPSIKRKRLPLLEHKKIKKEINEISTDKYEKQLLKYFDFPDWIQNKILWQNS